MPPPRTGSVETLRRADGARYFRARIRLADRTRVRVDVPEKYATPAGGQSAEERAELYAQAAQEKEDETGELLAKKRAGLLGWRPRQPPTTEMGKWLDAWVGSRTARGQTSTRDNRAHYQTHIAPAIGGKHVRDWTVDDLRGLSRHLDGQIQAASIAWKTARNVWATAGKMLADSVRSKDDAIRCRDSNPIRDVEGPTRGVERAHPYLYPSEVCKFVGCEDVPLAWRRLVAVAVYTFARASELRALRWEDVDLEHGTIHVHRSHDRHANKDKSTKTKITRRFALEPMIVLVLAHMKAEANASGCKATDAILPMQSERTMSRALKRWLHRAKIDRPELFADDATRQALRFHDLRATGITWMAVRGHTDYATTERYIREAEVLREGFGDVFPALPELSGDWATVRAKRQKVAPKYMKSKRGGRGSKAQRVLSSGRFARLT